MTQYRIGMKLSCVMTWRSEVIWRPVTSIGQLQWQSLLFYYSILEILWWPCCCTSAVERTVSSDNQCRPIMLAADGLVTLTAWYYRLRRWYFVICGWAWPSGTCCEGLVMMVMTIHLWPKWRRASVLLCSDRSLLCCIHRDLKAVMANLEGYPSMTV